MTDNKPNITYNKGPKSTTFYKNGVEVELVDVIAALELAEQAKKCSQEDAQAISEIDPMAAIIGATNMVEIAIERNEPPEQWETE